MTARVRIAFTSCMKSEDFPNQPEWDDIYHADPDHLLLLGDLIYMDYGLWGTERNGTPRGYSADRFRQRMAEKYERQWDEPHFRRLFDHMKRKENGLRGVYDDHDFAWNDAYGSEVPDEKQRIAREIFHHWMDCSPNRPELYGHFDTALARIIVLDSRSHADRPGPTASLLGDGQLDYLVDALRHDRQYTIIATGMSLTGNRWPWVFHAEGWRDYPREFRPICDLLRDRRGILFLGGDIHTNRFKPPGTSRPCYELASSGMAINLLNFRSTLFDAHNWGLLELDDASITVSLHGRWRDRQYRIPFADWWTYQRC